MPPCSYPSKRQFPDYQLTGISTRMHSFLQQRSLSSMQFPAATYSRSSFPNGVKGPRLFVPLLIATNDVQTMAIKARKRPKSAINTRWIASLGSCRNCSSKGSMRLQLI